MGSYILYCYTYNCTYRIWRAIYQLLAPHTLRRNHTQPRASCGLCLGPARIIPREQPYDRGERGANAERGTEPEVERSGPDSPHDAPMSSHGRCACALSLQRRVGSARGRTVLTLVDVECAGAGEASVVRICARACPTTPTSCAPHPTAFLPRDAPMLRLLLKQLASVGIVRTCKGR